MTRVVSEGGIPCDRELDSKLLKEVSSSFVFFHCVNLKRPEMG